MRTTGIVVLTEVEVMLAADFEIGGAGFLAGISLRKNSVKLDLATNDNVFVGGQKQEPR